MFEYLNAILFIVDKCENYYWGKSLKFNPFPKKAFVFTCLQYKSYNEQFLLFPWCFQPLGKTFCQFHKIQNCRLQTISVWKSLK